MDIKKIELHNSYDHWAGVVRSLTDDSETWIEFCNGRFEIYFPELKKDRSKEITLCYGVEEPPDEVGTAHRIVLLEDGFIEVEDGVLELMYKEELYDVTYEWLAEHSRTGWLWIEYN